MRGFPRDDMTSLAEKKKEKSIAAFGLFSFRVRKLRKRVPCDEMWPEPSPSEVTISYGRQGDQTTKGSRLLV